MSNDAPTAWQILELDPATATPALVKRAYAGLIKQHRPEADAAGFQRVHAAYQEALATMDGGAASAMEGPVTAVLSLLAQPAAWDVLESRLSAAMSQGNGAEVAGCLEEFRSSMKADATLWRPWGALLQRQFGGAVELLAQHLPGPGLVRLVEAGQPELAQQIADVWQRQNRTQDLIKTARGLLTRPALFTDVPTALCAARIARLVSFPDPALGEALANLAYAQLPPGPMREATLEQVNVRLGWGRIFSKFPEENARFWEERLTLDSDPHGYNWSGVEGKRQMMKVVSLARSDWPGYPLLQGFLPQEIWGNIANLVKRAPLLGPLGTSVLEAVDPLPPVSPPTAEDAPSKEVRRRRVDPPKRLKQRAYRDPTRIFKRLCIISIIVVVLIYFAISVIMALHFGGS